MATSIPYWFDLQPASKAGGDVVFMPDSVGTRDDAWQQALSLLPKHIILNATGEIFYFDPG